MKGRQWNFRYGLENLQLDQRIGQKGRTGPVDFNVIFMFYIFKFGSTTN